MYICSMFSQCNPTLSLISYLPSRDKLWSHTSAHSYEVFLMQIKFSFDTVTTCGSRGQVSNLREIFFLPIIFFWWSAGFFWCESFFLILHPMCAASSFQQESFLICSVLTLSTALVQVLFQYSECEHVTSPHPSAASHHHHQQPTDYQTTFFPAPVGHFL